MKMKQLVQEIKDKLENEINKKIEKKDAMIKEYLYELELSEK